MKDAATQTSTVPTDAPRRPGRPSAGTVFRSEAAFRRRLEDYVERCREQKRVPSVPGFCSYCRIMRKDFASLEARFPLQYDIACSTFLDEALNTKAANTGSMMDFLVALCETRESGGEGLAVLCDHDALEDGA